MQSFGARKAYPQVELIAAQNKVYSQRTAYLFELGDSFLKAMPVLLRSDTGEYLLQVFALKNQAELFQGRFRCVMDCLLLSVAVTP